MTPDSLLDEIELGARVAEALKQANTQETRMKQIDPDFDKTARLAKILANWLSNERLAGQPSIVIENAIEARSLLLDAATRLSLAGAWAGGETAADVTEAVA